MIRLYGLTKCSTCQKALAWLREQSVDHEFVDYRDNPIDRALLIKWAGELGGWEKLVNRASMSWRALSDEQKLAVSDAEWVSLIAQYPALVRRPLTVYADGTVSTGFNEKRFRQHLGLA